MIVELRESAAKVDTSAVSCMVHSGDPDPPVFYQILIQILIHQSRYATTRPVSLHIAWHSLPSVVVAHGIPSFTVVILIHRSPPVSLHIATHAPPSTVVVHGIPSSCCSCTHRLLAGCCCCCCLVCTAVSPSASRPPRMSLNRTRSCSARKSSSDCGSREEGKGGKGGRMAAWGD